MTTVNAYLAFNGTCEAAFNLYKSVFGGEFTYIGRYKDMPPAPDQPEVPAADLEKIMHVSLPISKETVLLGADMACGGEKVTEGTNFSLSVNVDSKEEARRIFDALAAGGQIVMPLEKTFWAPLFGMLTDKFGVNWMVNCE